METRKESQLNGKYPPHLERKKQNMMKRRRKIRIKRRFMIFMFLLVCAVIILTVFKAPFFDIKEIACEGQGDMAIEEIVKVSGLNEGENIFSAGVKEAEQNLKNHPEIDDATVQRSFPNKIKIGLKRAVPAAYAKIGTKVLIIDKKGAIIRVANDADETAVEGLAEIQGVQIVNEDAGKVISANDDVRATELYSFMEFLDKSEMLQKITLIDFSDLSDIKMEYEDRLQIVIGDKNNMDYKIKFINKIINERLSAHERAKINCRGDEFIVGPIEEEKESDEEKPKADEKADEDADLSDNSDVSGEADEKQDEAEDNANE